jgi:uncharacterized membrane protein
MRPQRIERDQKEQPRDAPRPAPNQADVTTSVGVGVFGQLGQAEEAARRLQEAGFDHQDISLVSKRPGEAPTVEAGETHADKGTVAGTAVGAILGGAIGLAAFAIPGIGPLIAAGPIVGAITGALSGGGVGALVGSFVGLGIPTDHAKQYEEAVRAGGVVLAVRAHNSATADRALQVLRGAGAREVTSYGAMYNT